jgi:integron integrase
LDLTIMKAKEAWALFEKGMSQERKAKSTRDTYRCHVRQFLRFDGMRDGACVEENVSGYLSWLARNRSAATQAQALNALVCFYRMIGRPLGELPEWVRPKERVRVPSWVTIREAKLIIHYLPNPADEVASMMIGSGLRIAECLRLRVKDLDFERRTVTIHGGKGEKSRVVMLAESLVPKLRRRVEMGRVLWEEDRAARKPGVFLPDGARRKFPRGGEEWAWFWLWPAPGESVDPETGIRRRHHRCGEGFSKALRIAVRRAGIHKRVTAHSFRHGFATAYLIQGGTLPELQELMGHANIETTQIYVHCIPQVASRVGSPLDAQDELAAFRKIG